ncbi:hypothetical protein MMC07_008761 [Pseudocyphellaria aurata]|nr:hypothetical protein [Pseudocyphellaria aurata]
MPYSLKGRNVLVTGGSRGLGALVAEKFAAEGCNVAVNYVANVDRAEQTAAKIRAEYHDARTVVVQGDVGVLADCERVVQESIDGLGGLDIIISNAGWTKFTAFDDLYALSEAEWDKVQILSISINQNHPLLTSGLVLGCQLQRQESLRNLHLLRKALPTFKANPDGGVFLMTSSVAGVVPEGSSMAYSVSKAAGLHLMKALALTQGPKVRVNAILPGLLLTEWGAKFSPERIQRTKEKSVLKKETDLDDCAAAFIAAAKNSSMTGQNVQIDSGLMMG